MTQGEDDGQGHKVYKQKGHNPKAYDEWLLRDAKFFTAE